MSLQITKGIQLPAFDVELLTLGKIIAVPFKQYLRSGTIFWLYPSQQIPCNLELEQYYQSEYLAKAEELLARYAKKNIQITAWGHCEEHWHINPDRKHLLPKIASSTVWKLSALEHIFNQHQVLKLLILRVYHLSNFGIVNVQTQPGNFYSPQAEDSMNMGSENDTPVVSEASFNQRKFLLLAGEVYPHTDLEALQFQVEQISYGNPPAQQLNHEIRRFLGWASKIPASPPDPKLAWINTIADLGNRSKELDEAKSNYQAGTDFENIARKSLEFLGFTIDYSHKGGAGGLDWFCSKPYPIVGECKAGKLIPSGTVEELIKLGGIHIGTEQFLSSPKLVIGPGKLGKDLPQAAENWRVSIINPMSLQKLVELQANYPNSINLIELKKYLAPGQIDDTIDEYIQNVLKDIKLRSHVVEVVKKYLANTGLDDAGVDALHGAYVSPNPPQRLNHEELHQILIELSSPLTGYLGRNKNKGVDWQNDRFYFLRDLPLAN